MVIQEGSQEHSVLYKVFANKFTPLVWKSGKISHFYPFLTTENGLSAVPFLIFKENRFNDLLVNGRVLHDHLNRVFKKEASSVKNTSSIAEIDFSMFYRLIREKCNKIT